MLTQCSTFSGNPSLPPVPDDIVACFEQEITLPASLVVKRDPKNPAKIQPGAAKTLTRKQVFDILAAQEKLDLQKSECGRRLEAFYAVQKDVYDNAGSRNPFKGMSLR
jgi:hypothetical protein